MFYSIVFMQGDDASEPLAIFSEHGTQAAIDHLAQWDNGEESEDIAEFNGHAYPVLSDLVGSEDDTERIGDYVLSYNLRMGYIGLSRYSVRYIATINTPGYLPWADPTDHRTATDAWTYLADERKREENPDPNMPMSLTMLELQRAATRDDGTGTVYGPDPTYTGDYPLGLAYTVTKS